MDYAKHIIHELLLESANKDKVIDAIKKRYEVSITYDAQDGNPNGKGERYIQPVAYGLSKSGNEVIRAFQPYGSTERKVPHWKLFRLDKIENWKPYRGRKFTEPPGMYNAEGKFNEFGDKSMSTVYVVADFKRKKMTNDKILQYNAKVNKEKVKNDPFYNFKRNIKHSHKATDDVMDRVNQWSASKGQNDFNDAWEMAKQYASAKEMQSIDDFGDKTTNYTTEPVYGNDANNTKNTDNGLNYRHVAQNGPYMQNDEIRDDNENFLYQQKQNELEDTDEEKKEEKYEH